jgi:hypothetical protein
MGQPHKHDIPAAGQNLLLPLYDPLLRLLGRAKHTHGRAGSSWRASAGL